MAKTVKFTETILRDGQQSQIATRMPLSDMLPVLPALDAAGYEALEVWGGATFDSCLRFLNEDPWERLRTIRKHVKHTKLQMLLRGQNLLGYRNYPDDVVEEFVKKSVENGISPPPSAPRGRRAGRCRRPSATPRATSTPLSTS